MTNATTTTNAKEKNMQLPKKSIVWEIKDDHRNVPANVSVALKKNNLRHKYYMVIRGSHKWQSLETHMLINHKTAANGKWQYNKNYMMHNSDLFGGKVITARTSAIMKSVATWEAGYNHGILDCGKTLSH